MNEEIEKIIDDFAGNISQEIATKRFYEIDEVKAIAKTRLSFALTEVINLSLSECQDQAAALKARYTTPGISGKEKFKIGGELAVLNNKIKKYNKVITARREASEYYALKTFVRKNYGDDTMQAFYNSLKQS
jgi:hypothetical protein